MNSIWQTLINTPWWVYLLLAYLIKVGIQASKTRTVELKKLFIIPTVFTLISIHTLLYSFAIDALTILTWFAAILTGMVLGWIQIYQYKLKIDKKNGLIQIPGTWSTLIIIMIIFITKYYFGYELAIDPALAQQSTFEMSALLISGICTGFFIGRLICYFYRFQTSRSEDLTK